MLPKATFFIFQLMWAGTREQLSWAVLAYEIVIKVVSGAAAFLKAWLQDGALTWLLKGGLSSVPGALSKVLLECSPDKGAGFVRELGVTFRHFCNTLLLIWVIPSLNRKGLHRIRRLEVGSQWWGGSKRCLISWMKWVGTSTGHQGPRILGDIGRGGKGRICNMV